MPHVDKNGIKNVNNENNNVTRNTYEETDIENTDFDMDVSIFESYHSTFKIISIG